MGEKNSKEVPEQSLENEKKFNEFQHYKLVQEVEDKLIKRAKKYGAPIFFCVSICVSICVFFIGNFGINASLDRLLDKKMERVNKKLEKIMDRADEACTFAALAENIANKAKNDVEKKVKLVARLETETSNFAALAENIANKAKNDVEKKVKLVARLETETSNKLNKLILQTKEQTDLILKKNAIMEGDTRNVKSYIKKELKNLNSKVKSLDKLIISLADKSELVGVELDKYKDNMVEMQEHSEAINEQFIENSQYRVFVHSTDKTKLLSNSILSKLSTVGFKVTSLTSEIIQTSLQNFRPPQNQEEFFDFSKVDSTKVVYTKEAGKKADYICERIKPISGLGDVRAIVEQDFRKIFGKPIFITSTDVGLIEIYIAGAELDK